MISTLKKADGGWPADYLIGELLVCMTMASKSVVINHKSKDAQRLCIALCALKSIISSVICLFPDFEERNEIVTMVKEAQNAAAKRNN